MKRIYFLATIAVMFVALGLACGSSSSGSGGGSAPADDDSSANCGSSASIQCAESAAATLASCNKTCDSFTSGSCQDFNCKYNCDLQYQPILIACLTKYGCAGVTEHQCFEGCDNTGISCLAPLSSCTIIQAIGCENAEAGCVIKCQTAG